MNWHAARKRLHGLRLAHGSRSAEEFGLMIGVDKTTVYAIENTSKYPNRKPDLGTLERWLDATSGESLAEFFRLAESDESLHKNSQEIADFPLSDEVDSHHISSGDVHGDQVRRDLHALSERLDEQAEALAALKDAVATLLESAATRAESHPATPAAPSRSGPTRKHHR